MVVGRVRRRSNCDQRLLRSPAIASPLASLSPTMVFEDFAEFNLAGISSVDLWIGAVNPEKFATAQQSGSPLPQPHSATWAPDYVPTLKTAITVETTELLELFGQ